METALRGAGGRLAGPASSVTVPFATEPGPLLMLTLAAMVGHPRQTTVDGNLGEHSGYSWGAVLLADITDS
jgi:hypothetical protein